MSELKLAAGWAVLVFACIAAFLGLIVAVGHLMPSECPSGEVKLSGEVRGCVPYGEVRDA